MLAKALEQKCSVKVLDRFFFNNQNIFYGSSISSFKGDIRDPEADTSLWTDIDILIHLAFVSNDPGRGTDPVVAKAINRVGFYNTLQAFVKNSTSKNKHVIFPSSSSIYGSQPNHISCGEDIEPNPISAYADDKIYCENLLKSIAAKEGFSYTILRPATVHGFSLRQRFDLLINGMILQALEKGEIIVKNPGCLRPNVHLHDLITIYENIVFDHIGIFINKTFNIAFHPQTSMEVFREIQKLINKKIKYKTISNNDIRSYNVSSKKILSTGILSKPLTLEETFYQFQKLYPPGQINSDNPYYFNNEIKVI